MTNPKDVEVLAREIDRLSSHATGKMKISEEVLARARLFSWEECARERLKE